MLANYLPLLIFCIILAGCQKSTLADSTNDFTARLYEKTVEEEAAENEASLKKYARPKVVHLPAKR